MAIKNELGDVVGLIGNLVVYKKNGKQQYRARSAKKRIDNSQAVFDSRNDFKTIMVLIKKFKTLIDHGFKDHKIHRSAYHSALSFNLLNHGYAKNEGGVENLDWFQFSEGNLSNADIVNAAKRSDGKIEISWQGKEKLLAAHNDDNVLTCLWLNDKSLLIVGPEGITRSDGTMILDPGKTKLEGKIEVFIGFKVSPRNYKAGSDRNVSKSRWVGIL